MGGTIKALLGDGRLDHPPPSEFWSRERTGRRTEPEKSPAISSIQWPHLENQACSHNGGHRESPHRGWSSGSSPTKLWNQERTGRFTDPWNQVYESQSRPMAHPHGYLLDRKAHREQARAVPTPRREPQQWERDEEYIAVTYPQQQFLDELNDDLVSRNVNTMKPTTLKIADAGATKWAAYQSGCNKVKGRSLKIVPVVNEQENVKMAAKAQPTPCTQENPAKQMEPTTAMGQQSPLHALLYLDLADPRVQGGTSKSTSAPILAKEQGNYDVVCHERGHQKETCPTKAMTPSLKVGGVPLTISAPKRVGMVALLADMQVPPYSVVMTNYKVKHAITDHNLCFEPIAHPELSVQMSSGIIPAGSSDLQTPTENLGNEHLAVGKGACIGMMEECLTLGIVPEKVDTPEEDLKPGNQPGVNGNTYDPLKPLGLRGGVSSTPREILGLLVEFAGVFGSSGGVGCCTVPDDVRTGSGCRLPIRRAPPGLGACVGPGFGCVVVGCAC